VKKPFLIYNLFPLLAGPFLHWEKHLQRAAGMGFNWVFVNPIQRSGMSGSLYSIADYHALDPRMLDARSSLAPEAQLRAAVEAARALGLQLAADLVVNHCAIDSHLLKDHPDWFVWEGKGKVAHPFCIENDKKVVWGDLAQFDHRGTRDAEGLYQYFFGVVERLYSWGFRAFRCDAAYQLPFAFWDRLIDDVKAAHPEVLFLAETLGCPVDRSLRIAGAGFDYIFNSSKWWDYRSAWLTKQYALTRDVAPSVSFPESHDTARLFDELHGHTEACKQRYLFTTLFSAAAMMPVGFEFAFRRRLHVVKTTPADWEHTGVDLRDYIAKVNAIKAAHPLFQEDSPVEVQHSNDEHVLVLWKGSARTREEAILILNRDVDRPRTFRHDNLHHLVQTGAPLVDVSPEHRVDHLPAPFHYELRPAQAMVLVTKR
jgi:starch synthase (maltosyl-transferring)